MLKLPTTRARGDVVFVNPRLVSHVTYRDKVLGGGSLLFMGTYSDRAVQPSALLGERSQGPGKPLHITMSPQELIEVISGY